MTNLQLPPCEHYYLKGLETKDPQKLMKMQTNHVMFLFFLVGGLHILEKQQKLGDLKQKIIDYVLSLQLKNGGFTCSTLYSKIQQNSEFAEGHIVFTYSAVNVLAILGALNKINKKQILQEISKHQQQDGSFSSFSNNTQSDLRFVYSALSICKLFDDFSTINVEKVKKYIESCYNFDGGFGLRPYRQSHCGAIYCAVASYQHLNIQIESKKKNKIVHYLVNRQVKDSQDHELIGVQGRVGKKADSCYSFWVGASIKILTGKNLLSPEIQKFLMSCFKKQQMSFSKYSKTKSGDPVHTFHSITGLKILNDQLGNLSLSHLLRQHVLNQNTKKDENN